MSGPSAWDSVAGAYFAASPTAQGVVDPATGAFLDANPALCAFLGRSRDELLELTVRDVTPPEDRETHVDGIQRRILERADSLRHEKRYLRPDGTVVWGSLVITPLPAGADGRQVAVVQLEDITRRKLGDRDANQLPLAQQWLLEQVPAAVFIHPLDPHAPPTYVSPRMKEITGFRTEDLLTQRDFLLPHIHEDDAPAVAALSEETDRTFAPFVADYRFRRKDGRWIWLHAVTEVVRDDHGTPLHWQGFVEDVTALKEAEAALAASEAQFRSSFEDAAIGMALIAPDGRFIDANPALCRFFGYPREELLRRTFQELTHPDDLDADLVEFRRVLAGEIDRYRIDKRYLRADGGVVWGRLSVGCVRDAAGRFLRAVSQIEDITARREAEDALRDAEARYRGLVEQVPAVVYTLPLDPDQPPLFVSPKIEALTGHTAEEASQDRTFLQAFVHPDDLAANLPDVEEADRTLRPLVMRYRLQRTDGRWIWLLDSSEVVRDDRGKPLWWQGLLIDITAETEAQQALAKSERLFRTSFENAAIGMAIADGDGALTDVNPAFCRLLGLPREELLAIDVAAITHPDDFAREWVEIARMISGEIDTYRLEKRFLRGDGTAVWTSLNASCVRGTDGRITLGLAQAEDISAVKAAEAALAESEARFRSTFESAPIGMATIALDGTFLDVNPAVTRVFGYPREEVVGRSIAGFSHPDDRELDAASLRSLIAGEISSYTREKRFRHRDGHWIWSRTNVSAERDAHGEIAGVVAVVEDISERKAAEAALAASEALFRSAFADAGVGMALATSGGSLTDVNPAFCRMLGYTRDELLAMDFAAITHPDDLARELVEVARLRAGEIDHYRMEKRYLRKDGSIALVTFTGSCVRGPGGAVTLAIGQAEDISAVKAAQEAVARSEELFRSAFANAGIGMALVDPDGRFLDVNPAMCRFFGRTREDLVRLSFQAVTHPDDLDADLVQYRRLLAGETDHYQMDKRYLHADGSVIWGRLNVSSVRGPDGAVERVIGQVEDITARREIEGALARSEELFRTTVHQSRIATGIADASGRFIDANDALAALTGYAHDELLGMAFSDLGHPEDNPVEQALFREALAGTRSQWVVEKRLVRKDGSTLWAWVNVSVVRNPAGGLERLIGQVVDVTATHEARQAMADALAIQQGANAELLAAARQRAEFLAMLAHDFRTPLTAIQGYGDLLLLDSGDPASVREYAATISGSAERLNRMVTDMLAIETMEARLGQLRLAPVDVAALVADAVSALLGAWPGRDVEIDAEPGLPEATLDRDQVTQAVVNLVGNALKYSPGGEPATISVRQDGPAIEIAVADRGIGIPADKLDHIFDKYARIRSKETQGIEGVGLGLPIVRAIARAHGGDAWAESVPGEGSTFRLRLPIAPPAGNGTGA